MHPLIIFSLTFFCFSLSATTAQECGEPFSGQAFYLNKLFDCNDDCQQRMTLSSIPYEVDSEAAYFFEGCLNDQKSTFLNIYNGTVREGGETYNLIADRSSLGEDGTWTELDIRNCHTKDNNPNVLGKIQFQADGSVNFLDANNLVIAYININDISNEHIVIHSSMDPVEEVILNRSEQNLPGENGCKALSWFIPSQTLLDSRLIAFYVAQKEKGGTFDCAAFQNPGACWVPNHIVKEPLQPILETDDMSGRIPVLATSTALFGAGLIVQGCYIWRKTHGRSGWTPLGQQ